VAWAAWTIKLILNRNDEGPGFIPGPLLRGNRVPVFIVGRGDRSFASARKYGGACFAALIRPTSTAAIAQPAPVVPSINAAMKALCPNRPVEKETMVKSNSKEAQKKWAEAVFKKEERAQDGRKAMIEYESQAVATRAKTARLKALRLAKESQTVIAL
jgi:hypothetical protein